MSFKPSYYTASSIHVLVRHIYRQWIVPMAGRVIHQQRLKLLWFIWDYRPILSLSLVSWRERLKLLRRFLRIDWNVPCGHLLAEVSYLCVTLATRQANPGEVVVEAGCWQGGLSAKLSIICRLLGYRLVVYDSFEGVETPPIDQQGYEAQWFFGKYAAPETLVREHLARYGEPSVCTLVKGWFSDTLLRTPIAAPIRLAYIDCDLLKGTEEAMIGVIPALVDDGAIFTEDYHLKTVREMLARPRQFDHYGKGTTVVTPLGQKMARIQFAR